ncbi:hypothetical protein JHN59_01920 [Streptomyces sp. MBT49]|uniref:hypothetical protein n=1 Tax=Streptomyces sp. MBT49 TaxID=1488380 RepID=UPI00190A11DD|nr:hypothetical protein [Streptomyces sp. MBT49]MBK3623615.1 hypothetical protein [Streptomyces sp. MBT49]
MDDGRENLDREKTIDRLEDFQKASVRAIEARGFEFKGERTGVAVFADKQTTGRPRENFRFVYLNKISEIADDLIRGATQHEEYVGVVNSSKRTAEYYVRVHRSLGLVQLRVLEKHDWEANDRTCGHNFTPNPPLSSIPALKPSGEKKTVGFHVNSKQEKICTEMSLVSPTAEFLTSSWNFIPDSLPEAMRRRSYSLKVHLDSSVDEARVAESSLDIASRMIFELDIRNGISLILSPRERVRVSFDAPKEVPRIRFPKVKVSREVAALFSFASETLDNPPYVFLSYYQVLEHFLPMAHRRDALKVLRRELRDPFFDENKDSTLIKLMNSIERTKQVGEEDQLKVLLRDFVRVEKITEFFASADMKHFGSKGPIAGVPEVSTHPKSDPLPIQVAKRIYALRNRVVHAKDDPKYDSIPVLLPRSTEANSLKPDVALARLLATEVLINSQD